MPFAAAPFLSLFSFFPFESCSRSTAATSGRRRPTETHSTRHRPLQTPYLAGAGDVCYASRPAATVAWERGIEWRVPAATKTYRAPSGRAARVPAEVPPDGAKAPDRADTAAPGEEQRSRCAACSGGWAGGSERPRAGALFVGVSARADSQIER
jgi:hypothetical protein